MPTYLIQH